MLSVSRAPSIVVDELPCRPRASSNAFRKSPRQHEPFGLVISQRSSPWRHLSATSAGIREVPVADTPSSLSSDVSKGGSPHGKWVRLYSTWVKVKGKSHPIIVKDNYGGRGVTVERVKKDRKKWLKAVTIMLQRQPGYDKDNQNWFYAKYKPDGGIEKNRKGMLLAGRVAKGTTKGCISCHSNAAGDDYLFSNDH